MNDVQVGQKSYQMPPVDGLTLAHNLTVADVEQSAQFYATVFGGRIIRRGMPSFVQIANSWIILSTGGGPTSDKPTVTLSTPPDRDHVSSYVNFRVADVHACYTLWRSRGAQFITEPLEKDGETRCYIRDPDGYIIEVGQSAPDVVWE
jgi:predicted enzyme related to lactoylglutathione lyase